MAAANVILFVELLLIIFSARNIFKLMTLMNLLCVVYDFYTAYKATDLFAWLFVWLINAPYLLSLLKVLIKPDSIHRRKLLIKCVKLNYSIRLFCDMWTAVNMKPQVNELCEAGLHFNPQIVEKIIENFDVSSL